MREDGGFTLFETLIGIVVMALMVTAVTQLFVSNLASVTYGKARAIGLGIASEQIETLRDLPYDSVATIHGAIYPGGTLADDQVVVRDTYRFNVHTKIIYVDDPYDGIESGAQNGKPQDLYPYDYKRAEVTVSLVQGSRQVAQLSSDFAGKAAETASNTGIISVKVVDADGDPVQGANVHIYNTVPTPDVDITSTTDNNGLLVIPKLPPDSNNDYQITASLAGYSTDLTYADPAGAQTATKPNLTVLAQQISSVTLSIDRLSSIAVSAVSTSGAVIPNLSVTATGVKTKYQNPVVAKNTYTGSTDSSGNLTLSNVEWDSYTFAVPSGYYIVSNQPYAPSPAAPAGSLSVKLVISTSSSFPDIDTATPLSGSASSATGLVLRLTGRNLASGTTLKLRKSGQTDITATGVSGTGTTLQGTLNLSGVATGSWDIVVSNSNGTDTQTGGFNVAP